MLSKRNRSVSYVRKALEATGYDDATVGAVVEHLCSKGLLNDTRLAEGYVLARQLKGIGPEKIRSELLRIGVELDLTEAILPSGSDDEPELARQALTKRLERTPSLDRNRAARFLIARGFDQDDVESALIAAFGSVNEFTE